MKSKYAVVGGQGQGTDMFNRFIDITTAEGINMVRHSLASGSALERAGVETSNHYDMDGRERLTWSIGAYAEVGE